MTDAATGTAATPLQDHLRSSPRDAIYQWVTPEADRELWQFSSNSVPVGLWAHEAADLLDRAALATREEAPAEAAEAGEAVAWLRAELIGRDDSEQLGVSVRRLRELLRAQPPARAWGWDYEICTGCSASLTASDIKAGGHVSCCPERRMVTVQALVDAYEAQRKPQAREEAQPVLTVWYGSMPESNGRQNWTATLRRVNPTDKWDQGFCFARSEYPERVRYEADRMRWIIGELAEKPDILAYDEKAHSGYVAPTPPAPEAEKLRVAVEALKPFAKEGDGYADTVGDEYLIEGDVTDLTLGDLRRAATALAALQQDALSAAPGEAGE